MPNKSNLCLYLYMNAADRISYFNQLSDVYDHMIGGGIEGLVIDNEFTEKALDLLELRDVEIEEISRYCIDEHDAITRAFKSFEFKELKQPVSLLLFYYIEYYSNFIEANWPFSIRLFREFRLSIGLAGNY